MRTEDELRAAFGSLERQLPDATRVLTGVARGQRRRSVRRRQAGGALAAAVLAAAAFAGLTVTHGPAGQLTAAGLRVKLLAAFHAEANDILVEHFTTPSVPSAGTVERWSYPWGASPGQQVRMRELFSYGGKKASDSSASYTVPAPGTRSVTGTGINVDYSSGTWSHVRALEVASPGEPDPWESIADQIASGSWSVSGPAGFRGHSALMLTGTFGKIARQTIRLWVDAQTYLPLHEYITTSGPGAVPPATADFELLPATPANLAVLNPVIPAGFQQMPGPSPAAAH